MLGSFSLPSLKLCEICEIWELKPISSTIQQCFSILLADIILISRLALFAPLPNTAKTFFPDYYTRCICSKRSFAIVMLFCLHFDCFQPELYICSLVLAITFEKTCEKKHSCGMVKPNSDTQGVNPSIDSVGSEPTI